MRPADLGLDVLDGLASLLTSRWSAGPSPPTPSPGSPCWRPSASSGESSSGPAATSTASSGATGPLPRSGGGGRAPPDRRRPGRVAGPMRPRPRQHPRGPAVGHRSRLGPPGPGGCRGAVAVLAAARAPGRGTPLAGGGPGHALRAGADPGPRQGADGRRGIAWWQEDMAAAQVFYEEALAIERELGDPAGIAEALYNQGFILGARGDFDAAVRLFEESLELFRGAGDETGMARAEWMIVIRDLIAGDLDGTVARAEEAVATWRRVGDRSPRGRPSLAVLYARAGRRADARWAILRPWNWSVRSTAPWGGLGHPRPGLRSQVGGAPRGRHAADRRRGVPPRAGRRRGPDQLPGGLHGRPGGRARAHLSQRPPSGPSGGPDHECGCGLGPRGGR